jgi:hypothetical protein
MKSLFLAAIAVATPLFSNAQFSKGDKSVGGSFNFSTQNSPPSSMDGYESRSTSLSIQPGFKYFISSNIAIGGSVGYHTSSSKSVSPSYLNTYHSNGYSVALKVRRYATLSEGFIFSLGVEASHGFGSMSSSSSNSATEYYSFGLSAWPAFHFFPTKNWSIEGGIGSIGVSRARQSEIDRTSTSFGIGLGYLNFGIAYYFRK